MDVRCERCGTEYEFDETKVTEAGVTVKCAQCGHLFKVRRRSEASVARNLPGPPIVASPVMAAQGERMWMVRDPHTGDVQRFRELTTLQQWIVERRVTREHEISRTGETWKPLGDIAELAAFFQVVDLASRSGEHQQPQPAPRTGAPAEFPSMGPQGTLFAPPTPKQPTAPQQQFAPTIQAPAQPYQPAPSFGRQELPVQRPSAMQQDGPMSLGSMPAVSQEPNFTGIGPTPEIEDDLMPATRPRWGLRIALIAIIGGGLGFGAYAFRGKLFGASGAPGNEAMTQGHEAFLADTDDGYIQADHHFQRAQAGSPGNPKPLAALAEVYSTWAMYLREDARLLDNRAAKATQPGDGAALRARAEEKRREADQKLQQAELSAKEALAHGVEDPDVNRGYALMEVVKGQPAAEVERFVDKAKAGEPERLFVEGALLLREKRTDEARRVLEDAVARSGDHPLFRVQYLLARADETLGRKDDAKQILDRLLRQNSKHERAKALLDSLAEAAPVAANPAPPAPTNPTAPPANPTPAPAPAPTSAKTGTSPETTAAKSGSQAPTKTAGKEEPATGGSYEQLVDRGNKLLEKGSDAKARAAFEEALKQRPQGPEAQTGLGNYFVSAGKPAMAILYFQKAADNGYGEALFYLAEAQRNQGAAAEALANYRKYLSHGAHGENVGIAQRAIRDLASKNEKAEAPTPTPAPTPAPPPSSPPEEKPKEKDLPPDPTPPKEKPPEEVKP